MVSSILSLQSAAVDAGSRAWLRLQIRIKLIASSRLLRQRGPMWGMATSGFTHPTRSRMCPYIQTTASAAPSYEYPKNSLIRAHVNWSRTQRGCSVVSLTAIQHRLSWRCAFHHTIFHVDARIHRSRRFETSKSSVYYVCKPYLWPPTRILVSNIRASAWRPLLALALWRSEQVSSLQHHP